MTSPENRDDSSRSDERRRTGAIVVALFVDPIDASLAMADLREAGFHDDDIGVAMQDQAEREAETSAKASEGAVKGAVSGGIVGGALGLLGSLLLPGIGPIVAGGVLATTLAGAGIGAATGGLIGALVGMGVSREAAEHFDRGFREGGVLVTVRADNRALEARDILRDRNADFGPGSESREATSEPWFEDRSESEPWNGDDRRTRKDLSYAGPERRGAA